METVLHYSWLIPLLPLCGAAVAGFFGAKWLRGQSHWPIWLGVGVSAVLSLTLLFGLIGRAHAWEEHEKQEKSHAGAAAAEDAKPGEGTHETRTAEAAGPARPYEARDWFNWIDAGPTAVFHPGGHGAETTGWYDPTQKAPDQPLGKYLGRAPVHFSVSAGAWFDPLTGVMLSVVCGIGFLITVFA